MIGRDVTTVLFDFGGAEKIDANGWAYGPLRIERGGGIAGNLAEFWITFPGSTEVEKIGPYRTKRELKEALLSIVLTSIKLGCAILDAAQWVN